MTGMTTKAFRFSRLGGADALEWTEVDLPAPGPREALLRHTALGLNFIDIYFRTGVYPIALPSGLGIEGVGVVEAVGSAVTEVAPGQRVVYGAYPLGAYAERRVIAADRLVPVPDGIDDGTAAAVFIKGMTARCLVRLVHEVRPGDVVLLHAAAGATGLLVAQWAQALGGVVIGTVGTDAKAALARENGCAHTIVYTREDLAARVREITNGRGADVVYDGVGAATFPASLDSVRYRGLVVSYGEASGKVPPFDLRLLAAKNSAYLTRASLMNYVARREELLAAASETFAMVRSKKLRVRIHERYPLRDLARAHHDLAARATTGSSILLP
jgi:NADPH2:quinone reductase